MSHLLTILAVVLATLMVMIVLRAENVMNSVATYDETNDGLFHHFSLFFCIEDNGIFTNCECPIVAY